MLIKRHTDFSKTLQSDISEQRHNKKRLNEMRNELGLENITKRNPIEKSQERFQSDIDKTRILRISHDEIAQLEDLLKLITHGLLEMLRLGLGHLSAREVEHFLAEQLQNLHIVLTQRLVGFTRAYNVADERGPVLRPLVLEYLYEDQIELVYVDLLAIECWRVR